MRVEVRSKQSCAQSWDVGNTTSVHPPNTQANIRIYPSAGVIFTCDLTAWRSSSMFNALDIRPASLPDDIGAAALALCQRGELRAALSLLYRGGLSRLVHQHRAAIGAASTEGECVRIAEALLPVEASGYFRALVAAGRVRSMPAGRSRRVSSSG